MRIVLKRRRQLLIALMQPPMWLAAFVIKAIYRTFFGWWLDPLLQRKANQALLEDVQRNFAFLFPTGVIVEHPRIRVLPFDYASVEIAWDNLLFCFTKGRDDVNVVVAPRHTPAIVYELGPVIAAVENRHFSERDSVNDLHDAANLLQPRLRALNMAFSEQEFSKIKQKL